MRNGNDYVVMTRDRKYVISDPASGYPDKADDVFTQGVVGSYENAKRLKNSFEGMEGFEGLRLYRIQVLHHSLLENYDAPVWGEE